MPQFGHGKVVEPVSVSGTPDDVQFFARSVIVVPQLVVAPRPPLLYACVHILRRECMLKVRQSRSFVVKQ